MRSNVNALLLALDTGANSRLFWIFGVNAAKRSATMPDTGGAMSALGGEFFNIPAVVSDAVGADSLVLLDASAFAANVDLPALHRCRQHRQWDVQRRASAVGGLGQTVAETAAPVLAESNPLDTIERQVRASGNDPEALNAAAVDAIRALSRAIRRGRTRRVSRLPSRSPTHDRSR